MIKSLIIGALLVFGAFAKTPSEIAKSFETMSKTEEYVNALQLLGTPDSFIDRYLSPIYAGISERTSTDSSFPLFTKTHFFRAETFRRNLNADPEKEFITQVIFATGTENRDLKVYFIFVHDKSKLIGFHLFEESVCDWINDTPVTLSFKKNDSLSYNIVFTITHTMACSDMIAHYMINDTMKFDGEKMKFFRGTPHDSVEIDRIEELRKEVEQQKN